MASIQSAGVPEISGVTIEIVTTTGSTSPEAAQAIESNSAAVLPFALCEQEISDRDIETLVKIAENKNATVGRLRRAPKKIPIAEPTATES